MLTRGLQLRLATLQLRRQLQILAPLRAQLHLDLPRRLAQAVPLELQSALHGHEFLLGFGQLISFPFPARFQVLDLLLQDFEGLRLDITAVGVILQNSVKK